MHDHTLGRLGEWLAWGHLWLRGYRVLGRNVHLHGGELDLVALDGVVLVFCEVKTRREGDASDNLHWGKQRQLQRLAEEYRQRHATLAGLACRFDAVLVERRGWRWRVEVLPDAFRPGW